MLMLRLFKVKELMGLKANGTIYNLIKKGLFTKPVRISDRAVAWPAHEVHAILQARISGANDSKICLLVFDLHAARIESPDPTGYLL